MEQIKILKFNFMVIAAPQI